MYFTIEGLHANRFLLRVELDDIEDTIAVLALIKNGIPAGRGEDIFQREFEFGSELEAETEVSAELCDTAKSAVWFLPTANYSVGFELDVVGVMLHDAVQVVFVPGGDPMLGERS